MKKNILLSLCLVSLISLNAHAYDCTDGDVVKGINNKEYCVSKVSVKNWYAAFAWCDAHNMQLATMHEICDVDSSNKWDGNIGDGKCLNMVGIQMPGIISATIGSDDKPLVINSRKTGYISTAGAGRRQALQAFCKMF